MKKEKVVDAKVVAQNERVTGSNKQIRGSDEERGMQKEKEFLSMRLPLIQRARVSTRSRKRVLDQTKSVAGSKKTGPWVRKRGLVVKKEGSWVKEKRLRGSKKEDRGPEKKGWK